MASTLVRRYIYAWAGNYRTVTMSKGGFPFAVVTQIPSLMEKFEQQYLQKYTPCNEFKRNDLVEAMALAMLNSSLFTRLGKVTGDLDVY